MLRDKIINAINEVSFDEYKEISSTDIIFADAVFASCKTNTCGNFGQSHSCPPLSGGMDIVTMSRSLGMTYNAGEKKVGFFMMVLY